MFWVSSLVVLIPGVGNQFAKCIGSSEFRFRFFLEFEQHLTKKAVGVSSGDGWLFLVLLPGGGLGGGVLS